jgi:polyphosphate kinase 2 (PPK2 family)
LKAQSKWDEFTYYKEAMFSKTHTSVAPWIIVKAKNKRKARLESIRYVLSCFDYDGKNDAETIVYPDPNIVQRFNRTILQID